MATALETPELTGYSARIKSQPERPLLLEETAPSVPATAPWEQRGHLGDRIAWQFWLFSFSILVLLTLSDILRGFLR